jgi:hypothetical protein
MPCRVYFSGEVQSVVDNTNGFSALSSSSAIWRRGTLTIRQRAKPDLGALRQFPAHSNHVECWPSEIASPRPQIEGLPTGH